MTESIICRPGICSLHVNCCFSFVKSMAVSLLFSMESDKDEGVSCCPEITTTVLEEFKKL